IKFNVFSGLTNAKKAAGNTYLPAALQLRRYRYLALVMIGPWSTFIFKVGRAFRARRDVLRSGLFKHLDCFIPPFSIIGMNRKQSSALFDAALIALGFVLRESEAHQKTDQSAGNTTSSGTSE